MAVWTKSLSGEIDADGDGLADAGEVADGAGLGATG